MSLEATIRRVGRSIPLVRGLACLGHYAQYRLKLGLQNFAERRGLDRGENGPMPPPRLRHRVQGFFDPAGFTYMGRTIARNLRELLLLVEKDFSSFQEVLDFGCGCGRVLQSLREEATSCNFYGTDIDPEAIGWCTEHLGGIARWSINGSRPPLSFDDETFDLIYANSVFTHLDEEYQFEWLSELGRVSKPESILILTVHGATCAQCLLEEDSARLEERGFLFKKIAPAALKPDGLPDFYQSTFHTREYVEREWSKYFTILHYVERGICEWQDAVVVRND